MRENTIRGSQSGATWPGSRVPGGWDSATTGSEPNGYSSGSSGYSGSPSADSIKEQRRDRIKELRTKYDQGRLKDLRSKLEQSKPAGMPMDSTRESWDRDRRRENMDGDDWERCVDIFVVNA